MVHPDAERVEPRFGGCSAVGCTTTSAKPEYDSMTLRIGCSNCWKHLDDLEMKNTVQNVIQSLNQSKFTLIFHALALSRHGEIEQLSAFSESGDNFSTFIMAAVRANTSPNLNAIPPMIYHALASEPGDAISRFIEWIRMQHFLNTDGNLDMSNVILASHFGSCHDHVFLLRTMMSWGIKPPAVRFSDTLALFKVIKGMDERAELPTLAVKYAAQASRTPHDADSDARILRIVVKMEFQLTRKACYTFSSDFTTFMERTVLKIHGVRSIYTFENDIWTDPALDSIADSESSGQGCISGSQAVGVNYIVIFDVGPPQNTHSGASKRVDWI